MPLSTVLGAQSLVQPAVCTTATRPASPYTGQAIYDTTVATQLIWNGTAWTGTGRIAQVVSAVKTDTFSTTATTYTDVTGWTATITPTTNTSKILVMYSTTASSTSGLYSGFNLVRGATTIGAAAASGSRSAANAGNYDSLGGSTVSNVFLDSPATHPSLCNADDSEPAQPLTTTRRMPP